MNMAEFLDSVIKGLFQNVSAPSFKPDQSACHSFGSAVHNGDSEAISVSIPGKVASDSLEIT